MTDKPMSQEEIDALLSGLSGDAPPAPAAPAALPAAARAAANPPAAGQAVVDQNELDALLGALAEPTPAAGPVDQAELDRLLDGLDTGSSSEALAAATAPPAAATPAAPLGQDDIDQILAGLGGGTPAPAAAPAAPAAPLGQDGIDALLDAISAPAAPAPAVSATAATAEAPAPPPATSAAPAAAAPGGRLDQGGIDDLLAQLGAPTATSASASKSGEAKVGVPEIGSASRGNLSRGTLALSTEDLTALVSKHAAPAAGADPEAMIDQGDIDALVKQLGAVSGSVEAPAEKPSMSQELAKHDAAIDQLLGEAKGATPANAVTMDALDMRGVLDKPPSTSAAHGSAPSPFTVNVPVLTPPELRGARWLLAAAVLLLAICAGTLVVVAGAVRTLGGELAHEREASLEPGDDYGEDFAAASARLSSPDEDQVAKGVLFLQRLKKRYPSHESEIALTLARHFGGHGAWREAAREYATALDGSAPIDDPRVPLENADALRQLGDRTAAKRQLYALLADEDRWTGESTPPRPAAISERNRRAVVSAHLLLGRLLDGSPDERLAVSEPAAPAAAAHGEARAPEHGAAHGEAHH